MVIMTVCKFCKKKIYFKFNPDTKTHLVYEWGTTLPHILKNCRRNKSLDKRETKRLDKWQNLQLFSDDEVQKIELPELRATIRKLNLEYLKEGEGTVGS